MLASYLINIYTYLIIFRVGLPLAYLVMFIQSETSYFFLAFSNFLLLLLTGIYATRLLFAAKHVRYQLKISTNKYYKYVAFGLTILIFNKNLPILSEHGSNALAILSEQNKIASWIGFVLLELTCMSFLVAAVRTDKKSLSIIYVVSALCIGLLSFSKAVALSVLIKYLTLKLFYRKRTSMILVTSLVVFGLSAMVYVLAMTAPSITVANMAATGTILSELFFYSANFVYILMFERSGLELAVEYKNLNNHFLGLNYFLNPFLAPFGLGITNSIGPYLNLKLFSSVGAQGVNPTLFFELVMVYGPVLAIMLAPPLTLLILWLSYRLIRLSVNVTSEFRSALLVQMGFYSITALSDVLYAIRSIFPLLMIYLALLILRKYRCL